MSRGYFPALTQELGQEASRRVLCWPLECSCLSGNWKQFCYYIPGPGAWAKMASLGCRNAGVCTGSSPYRFQPSAANSCLSGASRVWKLPVHPKPSPGTGLVSLNDMTQEHLRGEAKDTRTPGLGLPMSPSAYLLPAVTVILTQAT